MPCRWSRKSGCRINCLRAFEACIPDIDAQFRDDSLNKDAVGNYEEPINTKGGPMAALCRLNISKIIKALLPWPYLAQP